MSGRERMVASMIRFGYGIGDICDELQISREEVLAAGAAGEAERRELERAALLPAPKPGRNGHGARALP